MLTTHDIAIFLLEIGLLLGLARFLGEIARRYGQPMVVGEIFAGIVLGPTVFGTVAPEFQRTLFPSSDAVIITMDGLTTVAVVLLLLVAGIEINLPSVWRQRKTAFLVSALGMVLPFSIGYAVAWQFSGFFGIEPGGDKVVFALFIGTALSISALPVIAKTLMDMNLLKSDMGMLVMASAALNDIIGWIIFSIIISLLSGVNGHGRHPAVTIVYVAVFVGFMLSVVRWLFNRVLPWLERRTVWPAGVLGFVFACTMFASSVTEWLGVHAVFGAFLVGIAAGDGHYLSERAKDAIEQFTTNIFAPLFFATIGLRIDFAAHFDGMLVLAVFVLASIGKIIGCSIGAYWSDYSPRESLAIGFGMNARGAMEIILGLLALEFGLIGERLFVALVIMAIGTTMISGPAMAWFIREKKPLRLASLLKTTGYLANLTGETREEVIGELAQAAEVETGIEAEHIFKEVWEREKVFGTALGGGIAVPHARMIEITSPIVIVGRTVIGVDFDAIDGVPVNLVFLLLTPKRDQGAQLQILADIARIFSCIDIRPLAFAADNYRTFLDAIRRAPFAMRT